MVCDWVADRRAIWRLDLRSRESFFRAQRALECGGPPQDGFAVANVTPLLQLRSMLLSYHRTLADDCNCNGAQNKRTARLSYEGKITWLTFLAVAPAVIVALALLWFGDHTPKVQWTLTILIVGCMAAFIWSTREHAVRPLQTLSNLLAALREGDYSIRAQGRS